MQYIMTEANQIIKEAKFAKHRIINSNNSNKQNTLETNYIKKTHLTKKPESHNKILNLKHKTEEQEQQRPNFTRKD